MVWEAGKGVSCTRLWTATKPLNPATFTPERRGILIELSVRANSTEPLIFLTKNKVNAMLDNHELKSKRMDAPAIYNVHLNYLLSLKFEYVAMYWTSGPQASYTEVEATCILNYLKSGEQRLQKVRGRNCTTAVQLVLYLTLFTWSTLRKLSSL